jgi:prepilin signal peptidase PulO-like enzyme (type II secretory pathway)
MVQFTLNDIFSRRGALVAGVLVASGGCLLASLWDWRGPGAAILIASFLFGLAVILGLEIAVSATSDAPRTRPDVELALRGGIAVSLLIGEVAVGQRLFAALEMLKMDKMATISDIRLWPVITAQAIAILAILVVLLGILRVLVRVVSPE